MDRARRTAFSVAILIVVTLAAGCAPASSSTGPLSPSAASSPSVAASPSAQTSEASPSARPSSAAPLFDPTGQSVAVAVAATGLTSPLDVTNAGDGSGRLFVAEQAGRIRIVKDGALLARPFLDISARIASGGERGLLGIAFHPRYTADPRFFADYTDLDGNTVVSEFRVNAANPDLADPNSETVLLHVRQPYSNHNGGALEFGPDGMLYIALGDGGSEGDPHGYGRRLDTLLAKILRIDVDSTPANGAAYVVPPDNPFVATAGAKPEIWLTGLRNPWRMRFDGATGDLWIGDVGQNKWEEIDVARAGAKGLDYGWNTMEGFHCYQPSDGCHQTGLTLPLAEYGHALGCAVIGGVVVRDPRQGRLAGGYLFGDACSDNLWLMDPVGGGRREPVIVAHLGRSISSIGLGEDGSVYATSLSAGVLLRLTAGGS